MRSLRTWVCLGAVLFGVGSRAEAQSDPDVRDIPPLVMLVVDSSGSMEDQPGCICASKMDCSNCAVKCTIDNDVSTGEAPTTKKNRWAVTLEALTGKFKNFQCNEILRSKYPSAYDTDASYPYHQPWDCPSDPADDAKCAYPGDHLQERNGILDNYRDTLQFGLMTFDGEGTYVSAIPLIAESSFNDSLSKSIEGMWSYGRNAGFMYYGCPERYAINTGARSVDAAEGALISIGSKACGSASCDMYQINDAIQSQLLKTRPYGGTPIAASLDDLSKHLKDEVDVEDTYKSCRKRYAFLITDGAPDDDFRDLLCNCRDATEGAENIACPDMSDGSKYECPYKTAPVLAKQLVEKDAAGKKQIEKLFVLGMSVADPTARDILDDIAEAGNSEKSMFADDPNTLRSTLDNVFGPLLNPVSRSVPGFATGLGGVQYQISAGFQVSSSATSSVAPPWTGLIERRQFVCDPASGEISSPELTDKDRFQTTVNAMNPSERRLYTALPDSGFSLAWLNERMGIGEDTAIDHCGKDGCKLASLRTMTGPILNVTSSPKPEEVIAWMYGDSTTAREKRKLGDIYHSSPALVGPPKDEPGDDAYTNFRERPEVKERPLVMYITSNDGILHAISVEDYPLSGFPITVNKDDPRLKLTPGEELWGFVPPILLKDLHHQLNGHQFNFDGTPVVKDVFFKRGTSAALTKYHTVLITGMRGGGNAYIAMDVTDPFNPQFLWQFTAPEMGKTYGQPEIVQATFEWQANATATKELQTRAVAILPGGIGEKGSQTTPGSVGCVGAFSSSKWPDGYTLAMRNATSSVHQSWRKDDPLNASLVKHRNELPCWKQTGRALYFVDVETGTLIKKIFDKDDNPSTGITLPAPIVGSPTAYPDAVGTVANRGFVMDGDGIMWRFDMSSLDPKKDEQMEGWTMRPFHDLYWDTHAQYAGQVTYERPILSLDRNRRLVVLVGTGNTDNFTDKYADNRIVSLTEVTKTSNPTAPSDWEALINWELRYFDKEGTGFLPSELVTGSMALFEGQLFAASFISDLGTGDSCEYGRGRLWSLNYIEGEEGVTNPQDYDRYPDGEDPGTHPPKRIAVEDSGEDSDVKLWNIKADGDFRTAEIYKNLLIQGLSTTQRLSCYAADPDPLDSYFSPQLEEISQNSSDPASIWVVAQASSGGKRAGSSLGSVQTKIKRPTTFSRVTSWATNVD